MRSTFPKVFMNKHKSYIKRGLFFGGRQVIVAVIVVKIAQSRALLFGL